MYMYMYMYMMCMCVLSSMVVCDMAGHPGTEQVLVQGNAVKVIVRMLQGESFIYTLYLHCITTLYDT